MNIKSAKTGSGTPTTLSHGEVAVNNDGDVFVTNSSDEVIKVSGLNNFTATADPTTTDDSGEGYSVGSIWANVTDDTMFVCLDATVDNAVWRLATLQDGDVPLDLYINATEPSSPSEADIWLFDINSQTLIRYRDSNSNNQTVATMNRVVTAKDTTETITASESGFFLTNEGATGTVTLTMPTAVAGYTYTFYIQTAQTFTITANIGDTIRNAATVSATNGTISAATVGNLVTLTAINATEWVVSEIIGTWTIT